MLDSATRFQRLFHEICPLKIGDTVEVSPNYIYAGEWPGRFIIVGIRWEYQQGAKVNISIATEDDIAARHGFTDGFGPDDLVFVNRFDRHNQQKRKET
jgi:hypothetical protein